MAAFSGETYLLDAFKNGTDVHQAMADLAGCSRALAKNLNYAEGYGAQAKKFASMPPGMPLKEAKELLQLKRDRTPKLQAWKEVVKQSCRNLGYVYTAARRKRHLPDINIRQPHGPKCFCKDVCMRLVLKIWEAERQAINSTIQGTCADIMRIALARLEDEEVLLQVHDELVLECLPEEAEEKGQRVVSVLRDAARQLGVTQVPIEASCKVVTRWGDAK